LELGWKIRAIVDSDHKIGAELFEQSLLYGIADAIVIRITVKAFPCFDIVSKHPDR
jgi:hypothetical protein